MRKLRQGNRRERRGVALGSRIAARAVDSALGNAQQRWEALYARYGRDLQFRQLADLLHRGAACGKCMEDAERRLGGECGVD